jgi:hypothetical protein
MDSGLAFRASSTFLRTPKCDLRHCFHGIRCAYCVLPRTFAIKRWQKALISRKHLEGGFIMATLKDIVVTDSDNELIGLAVPDTGSFSSELFHFKFGGGTVRAPIKYTLPNIDMLPKGNYTLLIMGINWGGPANFDVTVNYTAGPAATLKYTNANPGIGAVYVPKGVPFTIQ